jgi:hypothetical protein
MDEARVVMERLDRIAAIERRADASPAELLDELRALVVEAERWARREADPDALAAASRLSSRRGGADLNPAFTDPLLG